MTKFQEMLATLTRTQARAYAADSEKWLHVEYNYLDVWGFKVTDRNVEAVEARFDELNKRFDNDPYLNATKGL